MERRYNSSTTRRSSGNEAQTRLSDGQKHTKYPPPFTLPPMPRGGMLLSEGLARSMDTTVTGTLAGVLRAADTGPKVSLISVHMFCTFCIRSQSP